MPRMKHEDGTEVEVGDDQLGLLGDGWKAVSRDGGSDDAGGRRKQARKAADD